MRGRSRSASGVGAPWSIDSNVASRGPAITGSPQVGQTLSTDGGSWDNAPFTESYQWRPNDGYEYTNRTCDGDPPSAASTRAVMVVNSTRSGVSAGLW